MSDVRLVHSGHSAALTDREILDKAEEALQEVRR